MRDRRSSAAELTETDPDRERFDAFVSYSHSADHEIAPKLQRALEVLAAPWFRARSLRVFRDATDLAANPGLWPRLVEALDASDFFVLMASPQAARSEWVDREVEYWLSKRSPSSLLLAITAGEFAWDHEARDFDWTRTDCIPRRLAGRFRDVPTAADLRGVATLELGDPAFTEQAAKIAAPIHGRTMRDLYDPEMRRYRRRLRIVGAVAVLVAVLLVIVTWQLLRIRARSREALAELLANRARIEQSIAPARAAFLAATADAVRGSARTRAAWIAAVHGLAQWTTRLEGGRLGELAPGGRSLVVVEASGGKRTVEAPDFAADREPQPPVDPPALRVLEGGECIIEDFFTPAPQGGDVLYCRASEIGFELRGERGSDQLWVTVSGDVRALPSPAACASAVLMRTDPVSGVESATRVDAELVRREGHPVRRSADDEVEEPVDAVGWAQLGNVERPATSSRCALLYLDETRQLRRWHPEQGQSLVSDTSFGRVRDYLMSPDGGWVAAEHENGTFVILQAEAASDGALAGIRWAAPLVAENGSYTGVALLDTPPDPTQAVLGFGRRRDRAELRHATRTGAASARGRGDATAVGREPRSADRRPRRRRLPGFENVPARRRELVVRRALRDHARGDAGGGDLSGCFAPGDFSGRARLAVRPSGGCAGIRRAARWHPAPRASRSTATRCGWVRAAD